MENEYDNKGFKYEIVKEKGVLSEGSKGWRKELNLVSWNGADSKYDLRDWAQEHDKMGKGITLTKEDRSGETENVVRNGSINTIEGKKMSGHASEFREATRVQMPAMVHLTRIGYKYFGRISEDTAGTVYDPDDNILKLPTPFWCGKF